MQVEIVITVKIKWWVKPYLYSLIAFALITGLEPDIEKVAGLIMRHGWRIV